MLLVVCLSVPKRCDVSLEEVSHIQLILSTVCLLQRDAVVGHA